MTALGIVASAHVDTAVAMSGALIHTERVRNYGTGTGTGNYTSTAFTTTANTLLAAVIHYTTGGANDSNMPSQIPTPTTSGLTWTLLIRKHWTGNFSAFADIWIADNASGGSKTIAQSGAGSQWIASYTGIDVNIVAYTGAAAAASQTGATASGGRAYGSGTDPGAQSITLSGAPAATSYTLAGATAFSYSNTLFSATPGSGFTELADRPNGNTGSGPISRSHLQHRVAGSTSTTVAWADLQVGSSASETYAWALVAAEIKAT